MNIIYQDHLQTVEAGGGGMSLNVPELCVSL